MEFCLGDAVEEVETRLQEVDDMFLQELEGERRRLKEECGDGRAGGPWAASKRERRGGGGVRAGVRAGGLAGGLGEKAWVIGGQDRRPGSLRRVLIRHCHGRQLSR